MAPMITAKPTCFDEMWEEHIGDFCLQVSVVLQLRIKRRSRNGLKVRLEHDEDETVVQQDDGLMLRDEMLGADCQYGQRLH